MDFDAFLKSLISVGKGEVSDIHFKVGSPPMLRIMGQLCPAKFSELEPEMTRTIASKLLGPADQKALDERMGYLWRGASNLQLTDRAVSYASKPNVLYAFGGVAGHRWFTCTDWRSRTEELYSLAAEAARALGRN